MRNLDLYGVQKVNEELQQRAAVLAQIPSIGEKTARMSAWHSFVQDKIKLDDANERTANLALIKHGEALMLCHESGFEMDIEHKQFVSYFFDELGVINRKVTKKGVQAVFYIFVALGLFGLYKLFF